MPTAKIGFAASCTDVWRHAPLPVPNPTYVPTYAATVENLVTLLRAKIKATLTEVIKVPESLGEAQQLETSALPFVGLFLSDPQDVSSQYPVNSQSSAYTVDFVYVAQQAGNGTTDDVQGIRARLQVFWAALLADPHLSGVVNRMETISPSANKGNTYNQQFATDGQGVSAMVLTMQFILVTDIPHA